MTTQTSITAAAYNALASVSHMFPAHSAERDMIEAMCGMHGASRSKVARTQSENDAEVERCALEVLRNAETLTDNYGAEVSSGQYTWEAET